MEEHREKTSKLTKMNHSPRGMLREVDCMVLWTLILLLFSQRSCEARKTPEQCFQDVHVVVRVQDKLLLGHDVGCFFL